MGTRTETFDGWTMTVTTEVRIDGMGRRKYYIVLPYGYKGPLSSAAQRPHMLRHAGGPFNDAEEAFEAAFRDCKHCIAEELAMQQPNKRH